MNEKILSEKLAYCAGIIDGEGCIRIKRSEYHMGKGDMISPEFSEQVQVKMTTIEAINVLNGLFPSSIILQENEHGRKKSYLWTLTSKRAYAFLVTISPYLRVKQKQVQNCLELRQLIEEGKETRPRKKEIVNKMQELYEKSKMLNR